MERETHLFTPVGNCVVVVLEMLFAARVLCLWLAVANVACGAGRASERVSPGAPAALGLAPPREPIALDWVPLFDSPKSAVAWSLDRHLAILSDGHELTLWDASSGAPRASLGQGEAAVFSASARYLAVESKFQIRVLARASLAPTTAFKVPEGQRLIALLDNPPRVVTQRDPDGYYDDKPSAGAPNEVHIYAAGDGAPLAHLACGPLRAFSPDQRTAVSGSRPDGQSAPLHVVTFPACADLAAYVQQDSGHGTFSLTHAAFSSDGKHAFMTVAQADVNGQAMTRRLLRWDGTATIHELARFEPDHAPEIDFDELLVDADASHVAFGNVRHFTPRGCVSCTYSDADSIGAATGAVDFLAFDAASGRPVDPSAFTEGSGEGTTFLPIVPAVDLDFENARLRAKFDGPGAAPRTLLVGDGSSGPHHDPQLRFGADWLSFLLPDGRLFFLDVARGRVLSSEASPQRLIRMSAYAISPDKHFVLFDEGRDVVLRRLEPPDLPRVRTVKDARFPSGISPWAADSAHFLVTRDLQHCLIHGCEQARFIIGIAPTDPESRSTACATPAAAPHSFVCESGSAFAGDQPPPRPDFSQLAKATQSAVGEAQLLRGALGESGLLIVAHGTYNDRPSEYSLIRSRDGARLELRFTQDEGPVFFSEDSSFAADARLLPRLAFTIHGQAGAGPVLTGSQVAKSCLEPDLLRRFVQGEETHCFAPSASEVSTSLGTPR